MTPPSSTRPPASPSGARYPPRFPSPLEQTGREVRCHRCGYDLRGLGSDGRCPECGAPIRLSSRGSLLRHCDPRWVELLRTGTLLVLLAVLCTVACVILLSIGMRFILTFDALIASTSLCAILLLLIGGVLLTAKGPAGVLNERSRIWRTALCIGLVPAIWDVVIYFAGWIGLPLQLVPRVSPGWAAVGIFIGHVAVLQYLRRLAALIPDTDLAARANRLAWAITVGAAMAWAVLYLFTHYPMPSGYSPREREDQLVVMIFQWCLLGVAVGVLGVLYPVTLARFARRFREAAKEARREMESLGASSARRPG